MSEPLTDEELRDATTAYDREWPLTSDEIAQLEHHIADHRVTCSYSCSLIRRMLDESGRYTDLVSAIRAVLANDDLPAGQLRAALRQIIGPA